MNRHQELSHHFTHVYLVDTLKDGQWVTEVRKYLCEQDPADHPDTVDCKNFRPLSDGHKAP